MATPINAPMAGEIWHLSIEDLFQPVQEAPRLGGAGPFVINLSASTAPISIPTKSFAGCSEAHVYQIQVTEDGRTRYRLRLGPFASEDEADAVLVEVRDTYPGALTATAGAADLRVIAAMTAKADTRPPIAQTPAETPVINKPAPRVAAPKPASDGAIKAAADAEISIDIALPTPALVAPPLRTAPIAATAAPTVAPKPVAPAAAPKPPTPAIAPKAAAPAAAPKAPAPAAAPPAPKAAMAPAVAPVPAPKPPAPKLPAPAIAPAIAPAAAAPAVAAPKAATPAVAPKAPAPAAAPPAPKAATAPAVAPVPVRMAAPVLTEEVTLKSKAPQPAVQTAAPSIKAPDKPAPPLRQSVAPAARGRTPFRSPAFRPLAARLTSLQHVVVATAPAPAAREVKKLDEPLDSLESTQTMRALTASELEDDESSRWFVIELALADHAFDPDAVPNLDIFSEYRLYSVAGSDQGRIVHALRLGFFREEIGAVAVASYLGAYWDKPTIKRVSLAERERFADQRVEARKDVGATGRHAVIEITDELVARRRRAAQSSAPGTNNPAIGH